MPEASSTSTSLSTKRAFDRFVNFSDAVFAIAITLLALDVRLPARDALALAPPLGPQLISLLPNLFAFALSFVVIGGYWVAHHGLFKSVERSDSKLIWINLLVLFFIVLLPFPTQVVADYGNTTLGVQVYAGAMVLTGLSILGLTIYAHSAGLTAPGSDMRTSVVRSSLTPLVFASSMVVAIWSPSWAASMWWLIAVVFFVVDPLVGINWRRVAHGRSASK